MVKFRLQQRFQVLHQVLGFHYHGVAAGHQQVADFGVLLQVAVKLISFGAGHLQVFVTHELCPAETEGAVGMASLTLGGEEQNGFPVLVLHTVQNLAVQFRHVHFHLAGGVWVQLVANLFRYRLDLFLIGTVPVHLCHALVMLILQHTLLGEDELVERVVRNLVPIDQFVDHILVNAEGEYAGYHLHFKQGLFREILDNVNLIELAVCVDLEAPLFELGGWNPVRERDDGVHRSPSLVVSHILEGWRLPPLRWSKNGQASIHKSKSIFRSNQIGRKPTTLV